jgi:hypothetical protein
MLVIGGMAGLLGTLPKASDEADRLAGVEKVGFYVR